MKKRFNFKIIAILSIILVALTGCKGEENKQVDNTTDNNVKNEINTTDNNNSSSIAKKGYFVEYKGNTYFWKISSNSRQQSALFANYYDVSGTKNSLVKIDKNGEEQNVFTDNGSGELFITNDKIFFSSADDDYSNSRYIYSVDLSGNNKKSYQVGIMKYIVNNYLICQTQNDGNIFRINTQNDEIEELISNANIIGLVDNTIYYAKADSSKTGKLEIGSVTDKTDNGIIATISKKEFQEFYEGAPIEVVDFFEDNQKIKAYIGFRAGTGNFLQDVIELKMDKDGKNQSINKSNSDETLLDEEHSYDEVYLKAIEENGKYKSNLMYVDSKTKERKIAMTEDEMVSKLGLVSDDEHMISLYVGNVIDDDLYVVLDNGVHNSSEDIGWRYSYKRNKTICFKFNTKSNEITEIYRF